MINKHDKLPQSIIVEWFKKSLVIIPEKNVLEVDAKGQFLNNQNIKTDTIKYLGNNEKKIGVIVRDYSAVHLDEFLLQFLTTVLRACNLHLGDVALININQQNIHYKQLKENLHITKCLLFGISFEDINLPLTFPSFKSQLYDSIVFMHAPNLASINNNSPESKLLKTKLWSCLQELFNLK